MSFGMFWPLTLPGIEISRHRSLAPDPILISTQLRYPEDGLLMQWARNASSGRFIPVVAAKPDQRAIPKAPRGSSESLRTELNIQSCPVELSSAHWQSDSSVLMAQIPNGAVSPPIESPTFSAHHLLMYQGQQQQPYPEQQKPQQRRSQISIPKATPAGQFKIPHAGSVCGNDFEEICERIWIRDDQRASIFLQTRLRAMVPGEYNTLAAVIMRRALQLMSHRFGNFLVQCFAEVASPPELHELVSMFFGKVVELSLDPFSCHVIQKVLEVSPPAVQQRIISELTTATTVTMTDSSGSHVWQKSWHLPRVPGYPAPTVGAHAGVMRENPQRGWMAIADTPAGSLTIRSFLAVLSIGSERDECLAQLIEGLDTLVTCPYAAPLVIRVALMGPSRARALAHILSRAYEYSLDPAGSFILTSLLERRIPGFAQKLETALCGFQAEVSASAHGRKVQRVLATILAGKK